MVQSYDEIDDIIIKEVDERRSFTSNLARGFGEMSTMARASIVGLMLLILYLMFPYFNLSSNGNLILVAVVSIFIIFIFSYKDESNTDEFTEDEAVTIARSGMVAKQERKEIMSGIIKLIGTDVPVKLRDEVHRFWDIGFELHNEQERVTEYYKVRVDARRSGIRRMKFEKTDKPFVGESQRIVYLPTMAEKLKVTKEGLKHEEYGN